MKDDTIRTARDFFLWLYRNISKGDTLRCYDDGYELYNENDILLAKFVNGDGMYEY